MVLTTIALGLTSGMYFRTSELVSRGRPPAALSPSQSSVLSHCQDVLGERAEGSPVLAVTGEGAREELSLVPSPGCLRVERYMKL